MTPARAMEIARKLVTKPPGEVVARIAEECRIAARRPWSRVFPVLLSERALLRSVGVASIEQLWKELAAAPFFLHPSDRSAWTAEFNRRYPSAQAAIVAAADRILRHEFDLLGSGPRPLGACLPWHEDFKTGRVWPMDYSPRLEYTELDRPTDVKVPWELSRCQHFTLLGQAYWLTGDEKYANEVASEIRDWVERNPYSYGVNWACAMDVALRAVNWIWAFYFLAESRACSGQEFRALFLRSLFMHGEYVATHLEKGPVNGNHYLSDGVGLVFLGCMFKRTEKGRAWLETGRAIVFDEMLTQVSADGVDFEVSTAYHRLVLELFATAYLLLRHHGEQIPPAQWQRLERMHEFVEAYTKPDGSAPLIGDADDGRVQILGQQPIGDHRYLLSTGAVMFGRSDLKQSATRFWEESFWLGGGPAAARVFDTLPETAEAPRSRAFPEGGFVVLRAGRSHLIIDYGDVGMRGIGGHGHNDILSFELVLDGMRLITDCGAYLYTASREWRNRFRSTAFHASIQVDGEEINRFISPDHLWQLRDDARPVDVEWRFERDVQSVTGAHTGYLRLPDPVRPVRTVAMERSGRHVGFGDRIEGARRHEITWRFPVEPGVTIDIDEGDVRFTSEASERWLLAVTGASGLTVAVEDGWVSPRYGVKTPTRVLRLDGHLQLPHELHYLFSTHRLDLAARAEKARELGFTIEHHATSSP